MEEEKGNISQLKRPFPEDESDEQNVEKRPRFPKGKKLKKGDEIAIGGEEGFEKLVVPQLAAKERAKRRNQIREAELFREQGAGVLQDISAAEVHYEENANFEDDGIQIEPFNLNQEREEGYFDADGNFVEFATQNEIKDAWLDSVEVDLRFAEKNQEKIIAEEDYQDLSSEDVGKIKRSIANLLQPGEAVIHALKRLKGSSSDKREKMSEDTKRMFDQLTEYAMKLMENGDYNVYYEQRETFEREAEGYERLARAKEGMGTSGTAGNGNFDSRHGDDIFSDGMGPGPGYSPILDMTPGPREANISALQVPPSDDIDGNKFDMFGEGDETSTMNQLSDGYDMGSGSSSEQNFQATSQILGSLQDISYGEAAVDRVETDYEFDESSGYYYSSSLGYYYDPATGLYCSAASGKWYSFNPQTGEYDEIQNVAPTIS